MGRSLNFKIFWTARQLSLIFAGILLVSSPLATDAQSAGACLSNPDSRALDFWLGEWSVAAPGGASSASSVVTLELDKCVVVERWDGGRGHIGENVFAYSSDDKKWHGLFADNEGRVHVFFDGKASPGTAQFTGPSEGPNTEAVLNRVTIRRIDANRVEQAWEKSTDGGKNWEMAFRGEYTRKGQ
jgi:hypothetical protein